MAVGNTTMIRARPISACKTRGRWRPVIWAVRFPTGTCPWPWRRWSRRRIRMRRL